MPCEFVREITGYYRCTRCRSERVSERRRQVKRLLVAEAGGACSLCGYERYLGALQFRHLDPADERLTLGAGGLAPAVATVREKAKRCVLLCANCHAEVEGGVTTVPIQ